MKTLRVALITGLLLGAGACGTAGARPQADPGQAAALSGDRLVRAAVANGGAAGSVTADIRSQVMGQLVAGTVSVDRAGHCSARLDIQKLGPVTYLTDGTRAWLTAGERLWGAERAALIGSRPVTGEASAQPFASMELFCTAVSDSVLTGSPDLGRMTEQGTRGAGAERRSTFGDPANAVLEITGADTPYVTRYRAGEDNEPYEYTYRDWNRPVTLAVPRADASVELSAVLGDTGDTGDTP